MNPEKFGQTLKKLRKKHHLTQKDLALKYNVTYQAVSKWENGLNMPDMSLIKEISKDFNISLEELLDGEYKKKKKTKIILWGSISIVFLIILFLFLVFKNVSDFEFKTLTTECEDFNISGTISYNDNKAAIYITNIRYCGNNDSEEYKKLECSLYEINNNTETRISSYTSPKENIKLEEFLQDVTLSIDDYKNDCDEYQFEELYLLISAINQKEENIAYKIPLKLESCSK